MLKTGYPSGISEPITGIFTYLTMKNENDPVNGLAMMIIGEGVNSVILDEQLKRPQDKYKVFTRYDCVQPGVLRKLPYCFQLDTVTRDRINNLIKENFDCYVHPEIQTIRLKSDNTEWIETSAIRIRWFDYHSALLSKYRVAVASEKDFYYRIRTLGTIAEKMRNIHQLGFVHNDLNPGNILVNEEGEVKIIDYLLSSRMKMHNDRTPLLSNPPLWFSPGFLNSIGWMSKEFDEFFADSYNDYFAFAQLIVWLLNVSYINIIGNQYDKKYVLAIDNINPFDGIAEGIANESVKRKLTDLWKDILEKRLLDWDGVSKRLQEVYQSTEFHRKFKCACLDYNTLKAYISGNPEISTLNKVIATYKSDIFKNFLDDDNSIVSIERNLFIKPEERVFADIDEIPKSDDTIDKLINNLYSIKYGNTPYQCIIQDKVCKYRYNNLAQDVRNQYLKVNDKLFEVFYSTPRYWGENWRIPIVSGKNPGITGTITRSEITPELYIMQSPGFRQELFDVQIKAINRPGIDKSFDDYNISSTNISWFSLQPSEGVTLLSIDKLQNGKKVFSYYLFSNETGKDTDEYNLYYDESDKAMKILIKPDYFAADERIKQFDLTLAIEVSDNERKTLKFIIQIDNVVIQRFLQKYALVIDIANTANVAAFDNEAYEQKRDPLLRLGHFNAATYIDNYFNMSSNNQDKKRRDNFTEESAFYLPSLTAVKLKTDINKIEHGNVLMGLTKGIYIDIYNNVVIPPFKLIVGESLDNFVSRGGIRTRIDDLQIRKISEITDQAMGYFKKKIVEAMREKIIAAIANYNRGRDMFNRKISFLDTPEIVHTVIISTPEEYSQQKKELIRKNISEITYRNLLEDIPINQVIDFDIQQKYEFRQDTHCDPKSMQKTIGSFFSDGDLQNTPELFRKAFEKLWNANCFGGNDILFISEPEAILNQYLYTTSENKYPQRILIYDLGGGTLDCLFLEKQRNKPQYEILKKYSNYYGGDIIDIMFLEWILNINNIIDYLHTVDDNDTIGQILNLLFMFKTELKLKPENVNNEYFSELRSEFNKLKIIKNISWQAFVEAKITGKNGYLELITETVWKHLTFNIPINEFPLGITLILSGRILKLKITYNEQETTLGEQVKSFFKEKLQEVVVKEAEKESVVGGLINYNFKKQLSNDELIANREKIRYPTYELGIVVNSYDGRERYYRNHSNKTAEITAGLGWIKNVRAYLRSDDDGVVISPELYEQLDIREDLNAYRKPANIPAKNILDLSSFSTDDSNLNLIRYHQNYHKLVFMMYMKSTGKYKVKGGNGYDDSTKKRIVIDTSKYRPSE